jgi:hypothetical protein
MPCDDFLQQSERESSWQASAWIGLGCVCGERRLASPDRDSERIISRRPPRRRRLPGRRTCIATHQHWPLNSTTILGSDTASSNRPIPAAAPFRGLWCVFFRPLILIPAGRPEIAPVESPGFGTSGPINSVPRYERISTSATLKSPAGVEQLRALTNFSELDVRNTRITVAGRDLG